MEFSDALTITALGMTVVFSGLLLTAGLIVSFGRIQHFLDAPPDAETKPAEPMPQQPASGPVVDPEVLTIITTVLEVERRLHRVRGGGSREIGHE